MATIAMRRIRSVPYRDAADTWSVVVNLLTRGKNSDSKLELENVAGVASSLITDLCPTSAPIIVTCDGPRTRIYCMYDEEAIEGSDASEEILGFDPLYGNWALSLPCHSDDLDWVQAALAEHSTRITARDSEVDVNNGKSKKSSTESLEIDVEGLLEL